MTNETSSSPVAPVVPDNSSIEPETPVYKKRGFKIFLFVIACCFAVQYILIEVEHQHYLAVLKIPYTTFVGPEYSLEYDPALFTPIHSSGPQAVEIASKDGLATIRVSYTSLINSAVAIRLDEDKLFYKNSKPPMVLTGMKLTPDTYFITARNVHTFASEMALSKGYRLVKLRVQYDDKNSAYSPAVERTLESFHITSPN